MGKSPETIKRYFCVAFEEIRPTAGSDTELLKDDLNQR
jgi:hypothetical protein